VLGWGHRTAGLSLDSKLERSGGYLLPHVRDAAQDAYRRAGVRGVEGLAAIEVHDCFTITEYLLLDHLGITPPGRAWEAIDDGSIERGGRIPVNPSGGLIGGGHPVGATGVRMVVDAARMVTEGAGRVGTLNIGGSATTVVSFVVGAG
jgi:acetyl-CoA C-acetyltransferase